MAKTQLKIGPHSQRESFKKLDGRGAVARRLKALRTEVADALGGEDMLSPQQGILIECLAIRVIRCRMLLARMLDGDDLSAESERRLNWHLANIRRDLQALGLERRAMAEPSLADLLGGKAA